MRTINKLISISLAGMIFSMNLFSADDYASSEAEVERSNGETTKPEDKLDIKEDYFSVDKIMKLKTEYNFVVDPTIDFTKTYPISKLERSHWIDVIKDISEYEGWIFEVNLENHTIKIIKKDKIKINLTGTELKDSHIKKVTELIKSNYPNVKVYKYKKVLYIEGEKTEVKYATKIVNDYYKSLANELTKYVINIYLMDGFDTFTIKKTPMVNKFEKDAVNRIVIKDPKLATPYKIDIDGRTAEFTIFENYIQLNDEKLSKTEMNTMGFQYGKWFIETKKIAF